MNKVKETLTQWWPVGIAIFASVGYLAWIHSLNMPGCVENPSFFLKGTVYDCAYSPTVGTDFAPFLSPGPRSH